IARVRVVEDESRVGRLGIQERLYERGHVELKWYVQCIRGDRGLRERPGTDAADGGASMKVGRLHGPGIAAETGNVQGGETDGVLRPRDRQGECRGRDRSTLGDRCEVEFEGGIHDERRAAVVAGQEQLRDSRAQ